MKRYFVSGIKSSLTRKLIIVSLLATLLPLLSWGIYIYSYSMRNVEKEYLNSVSGNMKQAGNNIASQVNLSRQTALSFAGETNLIDFLQYGTEDDYSMVNLVNKSILPRLQTALQYNPGFHSVRLLHRNAKIPNVPDHIYFDPDFARGGWSQYLKSLSWSKGQKLRDYVVDLSGRDRIYTYPDKLEHAGPDDYFALFYPIYSTYNLDLLGVFEITIERDGLLAPLKEMGLAQGAALTLVTAKGNTVYRSDENFFGVPFERLEELQSGAKVELDGASFFVIPLFIPEIDGWIVQYVPEKLIYQNSAYQSLILFGLLAVLLTTVSLSFFVFKLLLGNLGNLIQTIRKVKRGDLGAKARASSNDEIGELAREFNDMTQKISELLGKVEESGKAEKEAVYKSLENQISPHFLCNALDAVRMTAEVQDNRDIARAIERISSYFMYNIYRRSKEVTLAEELTNVTDYLDIHNMIRKDPIEYAIKASSDLEGRLDRYTIMKFTLQPIIENAVKHGFAYKLSKCFIRIGVSLEGGNVRITIEDNGAGMNGETLDSILADGRQGIGLANIKERLELNYGYRQSFRIQSYEGVGTQVIIDIPA